MVTPPCGHESVVQTKMEKRLQQADNRRITGGRACQRLPQVRGSVTELAMGVCALKKKAGSALTSATTAGQGRPSPRGKKVGERCER